MSLRLSLLFILLSVTRCQLVFAQQCMKTFQSSLQFSGDARGNAVVYTRQGEIVICGTTNAGSAGGNDGVLLKTDDGGNPLWVKSYGQAGNETLYKVKQTADNGFIAIGTMETAGLPQIWVVRTDAAGQLIWNRIIDLQNTPASGKDIIELHNGGYALVATTNDSTAAADGLVARLDAGGDLLWMRKFDSGGEDGFNSLVELNNVLVVTGFITYDLKDAFLLRINILDGTQATQSVRCFRTSGWNDEGICMNPVNGGYSWGMKITQKETGYDDSYSEIEILTNDADDKFLELVHTPLYINGNNRVRHLQLKPLPGGNHIVTTDEVNSGGWPEMILIGKDGKTHWTRDYRYGNSADAITGLDITDTMGYVATGTYKSPASNEIYLLKTDINGIPGRCTSNAYGSNDGGGDIITATSYDWNSSQSVAATAAAPVLTVKDQSVTVNEGCNSQVCSPAPPVDNGENCATSFLTSIKENYSTDIKDAVRTADGDIALIGSRSLYYDYGAEIIKLKPGGNVRWAKQYTSGLNPAPVTLFSRLISTKDNHLVAVGAQRIVLGNDAYEYGVIMKLDYNGNVVWSNRLSGEYSPKISFVRETEDGGLLLGTNANWGFPPIKNILVKLDASGKITWAKELTIDFRDLAVRAVLYDKGSFYLALDVYNKQPAEIEVVKLDATNGNYQWSKHFRLNDETVSILGLEKIKDVVYVGMGLIKEISWENYQVHAAVLKLRDDDGSQLPSFRMNAPNMSLPKDYVWMGEITATTFTKSADDQLLIAHESASNKDTTLRVHKLSTDGKVTWSGNFTRLKKHEVNSVKADGTGLLIAGRKRGYNVIGEEANEGFLLRVDANGEIAGGSGDCASQQTGIDPAAAYTTSLKMEEGLLSGTGTADIPLLNTSQPYVTTSSPVLSYPSCATFATCQEVKLAGSEKICDLTVTYTYQAKKDNSCTAPLNWKTDPAYVDIISQSGNDITVKYKQQGNTTIAVQMDLGCRIQTAQVMVTIGKAASALDLGTPPEICPGATVKLDAGAGFETYQWQDGSKGQTFKVTEAGSYEVTVTDICKAQANARVTVVSGGNYPFSLGPDILKCAEQRVTIDLPVGFENFTWNTDYNRLSSAGKVTLFPALDTTYILEGDRGNGCRYKDTLKVMIEQPDPIGLPADKSICAGEAVSLEVPAVFNNITWSDGQTGNFFSVNVPGTYTVAAKDLHGCISKDTFRLLSLLPLPQVFLPKEDYLCMGSSRVLDAGNNGSTYLWSTGEVSRSITVKTTGKWWVQVTGSNGCMTSDTAWYKKLSTGPDHFLVSDTTMCLRGEILIPAPPGYRSYAWSDGTSGTVLHAGTPGIYWLSVTDNSGCTGRNYIRIAGRDCGHGVYVPTAFTPNNDGINDVLRPVALGRVNKFLFMVFDRWGNLVYQTNQLKQGWDGMNRSMPSPAGTYIWTCSYQLDGDPEQLIKGSAVLIR